MFAFQRYGPRALTVASTAAFGSSWYTSTRCEEVKAPPDKQPVDNVETKLKSDSKGKEKCYFGSPYPSRMIHTPKIPYPLWDEDWDGKQVKDVTSKEKREIRKKGVTRHVILVRHGQYVEDKDPDKKVLTPLGKEQAEATGVRLAEMLKGINEDFDSCNIKIVRVSNMIRARETADIIAKHLPGVAQSDPDPDLNEGRPSLNIPGSASQRAIDATEMEHPRIERAFKRYFYRASYESSGDDTNEEANTTSDSSDLRAQIERDNPAEENASDNKLKSKHEFEIM